MDTIILLFFRYGGIVTLVCAILFFILYRKNELKKIYKVLMIISIILFIINIGLWLYLPIQLKNIFEVVENNITDLII